MSRRILGSLAVAAIAARAGGPATPTQPTEAQEANAAALLTGPDWYRHAVFYEVNVRSFADSNGDGIGDLAGLESKLDYLKDLGVDAIRLRGVRARAVRARSGRHAREGYRFVIVEGTGRSRTRSAISRASVLWAR